MTLNIAALRDKLNRFNKQSGEKSDALWKPTEGKHVVRIVPWKENKENPFIELYFHYLGNKSYLSPTSYGNRDPILEFAEELASEGKEGWEQSRPFRPSMRVFLPVIVRNEEEKGVRFMSFTRTVYKEILSIIADPDYGDITDIKSGRDIVVEYIPKEKSDTGFAKTTVRAKPNVTPLSTNVDLTQKFLTEQPDIKAIFKEPTFEELKVALAKYLDPDNAASMPEPVQQPVAAPQSATTAKSSSKTSTSVKDMIDEFDEVFN